jgi:3-methyladenine DNA glycosylase AlkD
LFEKNKTTNMTSADILKQLESLGLESIKKVLLKHGIKEPLYGVKIEELKQIQKKIKQDHALSLELYASGIYDAMYLAGLIAEPEKMSRTEIQKWAQQANAPVLRESTVASVASESRYGMELALKWIDVQQEDIVTVGWATLSDIVAIKEDSELDISLLQQLLQRVAKSIHGSGNRVKMTMNGFVIAVGSYVAPLNELAKQTAIKIGKVAVDMGDTACNVPSALAYIAKAESKKGIGVKKKSARC